MLIAAPVFILMAPLLLGLQMFTESFSYTWLQQVFYFYQYSVKSGDSMLWNPLVFSGFPMFVSFTGGFFSPIVYFLIRFIPAGLFYHWLAFLCLVLSGFFTAMFLKRMGAGFVGAYIAGLAFVSSQWFLAPDVTIMYAAFMLPLLFLLLLEISEKNNVWLVFVGIISIGLAWFSTHWHYFIEVLLTAGVFAVYLSLFKSQEKNINWRVLLSYFYMFVGGSLIGLIQLIPTVLYIEVTKRAAGFRSWDAIGGGSLPWDIITLFLPYAYLPIFNNWPWIYIGILPLFFSIFVLCIPKIRSAGFIGFFSFLTLFSYALSVERSPLFWLFLHLPMMNLLHAAHRWILITAFSLAVLSGFGFDMLFRPETDRISKKFFRFFGYASAGIVGMTAVYSITIFLFENQFISFLRNVFLKYFYSGGPLSPEYYFSFIDKNLFFIKHSVYILDPRVFFSVLFLLGALILLRFFFSDRIGRSSFQTLVFFFVILNFIFVFWGARMSTSSKILDRMPETVSFLKERGPGKTFSVFWREVLEENLTVDMSLASDWLLFGQAALLPNNSIRYGIESADYFDELLPRRMARILSYLYSSRLGGGLSGDAKLTMEERMRFFGKRRNLLNFLSIKYVLTPHEFPENSYFKKIYAGHVSSKNIPLYIYENSGARPKFYFAESIEIILEDEEAAFEKLKTIPEGGRWVFVECGRGVKVGPCAEGPALNADGQGRIEVKIKKNALSILTTKSEKSQLLVFSENNIPAGWWKAYVDGNETPIYTVGSVYMGVMVPEGEHEIRFELTYRAIIEEFFKKFLSKF